MPIPMPLCRIPETRADVALNLSMVTRHGLVTGATGTGKTVTLQALAEALSRAGVPVLCCDIKGDLSGIAAAGGDNTKIAAAFGRLGLPEPEYAANPTAFWDVAGAKGHPLRATVSDLGPLLLGRLLGLKEVQADTLRLLFRVADERGLPILDLADLRAMVEWATANAASLKAEYGLMSGSSLGAIQRSILVLDDTGAGRFFGEPALDIADLMRVDANGRGVVNVLAADGLMAEPELYATVLLHLLGEVFEELPEAGDPDKPKLVLLIDEAHLMFDGAPAALVQAVERTARLVRSKGVGLWLVTQSPLDVPESVLGQLGNRIHHALRAYTPKDRKAVDSVAETLRPNPLVDAAAVITELGVGEALVSFLDREGRPTPVERVMVVPPASRIGPLDPGERARIVAASPMGARYGEALDRESAYEILKGKIAGGIGAKADETKSGAAREPTIEEIEAELRGLPPEPAPREPAGRTLAKREPARRANGGVGLAEDLARAALSAAGRELGRQAVRSLLGTRRRRR
ncbi:MAG: ATP-binding protein [Spirochaetae bacterium HGW-Spirochaetae-3]|jgi:hypothetical protein|nr:MAG: ATP-binding protein [Spirochaetae bacterium HGW-Spirochaetae-3]